MVCFFFVAFLILLVGILTLRYHLTRKKRTRSTHVIAFFHPFCNAAGGGEKVLWLALQALQHKYPNLECLIYTGDTNATKDEILERVKQRLNIDLPREPNFVFLSKRYLVEAKLYPYFTLLGQSLGSLVLGFEALSKAVPDIVLDTQGYAFVMPLFKYLGGCQVGCYTHYPTISTDMLQVVASRAPTFNNNSVISRNPYLTRFKIIYYHFLAWLYGLAGKCADVAMVNSSWTQDHILKLWNIPKRTFKVYPPCNIKDFAKISLDIVRKERILSIAQFRPEKDHSLQLRAFRKLRDCLPIDSSITLVLAGGCRNQEDYDRVAALKQLSKNLAIEKHVVFLINISFEDLKKEMETAMIGLHTMWNEHFGIGVVECMAAGLVMVAHASGGPKEDIVVPLNGKPTGYLASTEEEFSQSMKQILSLSPEERKAIVINARQHVSKFSEEKFIDSFLHATQSLFRQ